MNRTLLLVSERPAGWHVQGIVPLLNQQECAAYGALVGAGLPVEVSGMSRFLGGGDGNEGLLAVVVRPTEGVLKALEEKMRATGGCLLAVRDGDSGGSDGVLRLAREISGVSVPLSLRLSRLSGYRSARGLRRLLSSPLLARLRPAVGDEIVARWRSRDSPAILSREMGKDRSWAVGFPLDHLDRAGLSSLLQVIAPRGRSFSASTPHLPTGARAVVLLLHDVEQALPGDPGGARTVRNGIEACLEAQARHSLRATYNLVGTFAEEIPDLVRRIAAEGHEVASHGASHRVVADLDPAGVREEVEGAEKRIVPLCGADIRGFRSPRSRWSSPLLDLLQSRAYLWNAEADPSPFPYHVPRDYSRPLIRVPVAVDDWDYVRRRATPRAVTRLWKREVRRAIDWGCWVGIGSHPSVLGLRPERMRAFGEFLDWLADEKVTVMTMREGAEWWLQRTGIGNDPPAATGETGGAS